MRYVCLVGAVVSFVGLAACDAAVGQWRTAAISGLFAAANFLIFFRGQ